MGSVWGQEEASLGRWVLSGVANATCSGILPWEIPWAEEQGGTRRMWVALMGFELGKEGQMIEAPKPS